VLERLFEARATLGLRRLGQVVVADRQEVEGHVGRRGLGGELLHARDGWMNTLLQALEVEPPLAVDEDDLAVEHDPLRKRGFERGLELRKVSIERSPIPALDVERVAVAENEGPEPVPLRLEETRRGGRKALDELRQHRLDRRRNGQHHGGTIVASSDPGLPSVD
jgi:hypothetical protein